MSRPFYEKDKLVYCKAKPPVKGDGKPRVSKTRQPSRQLNGSSFWRFFCTQTSGDLNFRGQDGTGNYYNAATLSWTGYADITVGVTGNKDKLSSMKISSSTVPIPPSVFLLGSGLSGLFFFRRRGLKN